MSSKNSNGSEIKKSRPLYWLTSQLGKLEIVDGQARDLNFLVCYLFQHRLLYQPDNIIRIRKNRIKGKVIVISVPGQKVKYLGL